MMMMMQFECHVIITHNTLPTSSSNNDIRLDSIQPCGYTEHYKTPHPILPYLKSNRSVCTLRSSNKSKSL